MQAAHFLPTLSVSYCHQLWNETPFIFRVAKPRQTKLGDFFELPSGKFRITVNGDLSPTLFLFTLIHEIAHLRVTKQYRARSIEPHGKEWRQTFTRLMQPLLREEIFPEPLLSALRRHMENPKASCYADRHLILLNSALAGGIPPTTVGDLPLGSLFYFQNKWFVRGKSLRSRAQCAEVVSDRKYVVSLVAPVQQWKLPDNVTGENTRIDAGQHPLVGE